MGDFTPEQESAIDEKIELFSPLIEKEISQEEVMKRVKEIEAKITAKRLEWFEEHKDEFDYLKRDDLTDAQKAFALLFGSYMGIKREDIAVFATYDGSQALLNIQIQSKNFCPYLEAFKRMGIIPRDSVKICELALEEPCRVLVKQVNPDLNFYRKYERIRPCADYCLEGIITWDASLCDQFENPCDLFILNADPYLELV